MDKSVRVIILFILINRREGFETSPCPRLFVYEHMQVGRWYGVISLISPKDIKGIQLYLVFDTPSLQLGNWFGEVSTTNNKDYLIQNTNFTLKAHKPQPIRFYLNYNSSSAPKLTTFSLNDQTLCPETTTTNSLNSSSVDFHPPVASDEEEDFYPSDFAFIKPNRDSFEDECGTVITARSKRQLYPFFYALYPDHGINHIAKPTDDTFQPKPKPLITHGKQTAEGEYPWHAALYRAKRFDLVYVCGGALISSVYVITVAHCVTRRKTSDTLNPHSMRVYLGKYYLMKFSNPGIQDHAVDEIRRHPQYNAYTYANDIAMVKLAKRAQLTIFVRPVCLWPHSRNLDSIVGEHGEVVGWGYDQHGKITDRLMQIVMPVVTQGMCIRSNPLFYSHYTTDMTYCAGYNNGSSVCNGDSGGGMVFLRKDTMRWYLRGLVSISIALRSHFCDYSNYVVFTDTGKYLDWIRSIIAK